MWGDDPQDYKTLDLDRVSVSLPCSANLSCGCEVELDWVFTCGNQYAQACIATSLRPCNTHGWALQTTDVETDAKELAQELFRRYQEHCVSPHQ